MEENERKTDEQTGNLHKIYESSRTKGESGRRRDERRQRIRKPIIFETQTASSFSRVIILKNFNYIATTEKKRNESEARMGMREKEKKTKLSLIKIN